MQDEQRSHTPGEGTHTFHSLSGVRYQGGAHRKPDSTTESSGQKEINWSFAIGHLIFDIPSNNAFISVVSDINYQMSNNK